jgi:hypothetical protein
MVNDDDDDNDDNSNNNNDKNTRLAGPTNGIEKSSHSCPHIHKKLYIESQAKKAKTHTHTQLLSRTNYMEPRVCREKRPETVSTNS